MSKKVYFAVEKGNGFENFKELLKEISFKGRFDIEEYDLDLEGNLLLEGEIECFNDDFKDIVGKYCEKENAKAEILGYNFNEKDILYIRWGKSGNVLSEKTKYEFEFVNRKKAKKMKTKLLFSWFDKTKNKEVKESFDKIIKDELEKENKEMNLEYENRIEDEAIWLLDVFLIKDFEVIT